MNTSGRHARRARHSNGNMVSAHQRAIVSRYQNGDWYFTRDAKSGSMIVRCVNLMKLLNGEPQMYQSYAPTRIAIDGADARPGKKRMRRRTISSNGTMKTISLKRSANATPMSRPAKKCVTPSVSEAPGRPGGALRSERQSAAATMHNVAIVRGYTVLPNASGIQCSAYNRDATRAVVSFPIHRSARRFTSQIVAT